MDKDTLGYSGRKGSKNLGELASGDYLTFGALIWRRSGGLTPTTNNFQVQEMSMEPHPLRAWRTKQTYRIATRGDPVENVVVAALQFEFLQSGALLNEARINDFLRETGLPSVYATIQTKQSSQRSCLFPTTIHFGDFTNRCPLSHLQNLVFLCGSNLNLNSVYVYPPDFYFEADNKGSILFSIVDATKFKFVKEDKICTFFEIVNYRGIQRKRTKITCNTCACILATSRTMVHLLKIVPINFTWVPTKLSLECQDIGSRPKPSVSQRSPTTKKVTDFRLGGSTTRMILNCMYGGGDVFLGRSFDPLGDVINEVSTEINVRVLNLAYNAFNGFIPQEIGALRNLRELTIQFANLTGTIPNYVGNLSFLSYLSLWNCNLTGSIPISIGKLSNLSYLELTGNKLYGHIPHEIGNLSLASNNLHGYILQEIGKL
ncbi:hypothetical protein JHK85_025448 [Glycine max]|nr:hypothetical protein JHK85_025448 [Glycine max]